MNNLAKKATILGIVGNIILFILKSIVGFVYNSLAVISDALNSFTDIDVRAHYVGVLLQLEIHIEVDKKLTIYRAHTIGKKVQNKLEKLDNIDRAFVHIDPVG